MDPKTSYPSSPLARTESPFVQPPQQQDNVPMPDAPRPIRQDQDVDMEDVSRVPATGTREAPHHQYPGQTPYRGQVFPLELSPPQQPLPNPLQDRSRNASQQRSSPWQPARVPQYEYMGRQELPTGYTGQQPAAGHQLLPVPQHQALSPVPPRAPPGQQRVAASIHSRPMTLSSDPMYQHDLKSITRHFASFAPNGTVLPTAAPGQEHLRRIEYIPMVFKSALGETKVLWDVVMDGVHYEYTGDPQLHLHTSSMGQAV
ncbi:hypothetical protein QBC40DRAFT_281705 [Triangularia verruculosa]|uniref:Uncharacterized protein n=1 Tax=Triangularia verruculosa TaxID=2587418 RepID=A0AAN6XG52_9PEZI|nr:hypothetical protein QBC40DRAFT_281705 [Triangularia verruculosa]